MSTDVSIRVPKGTLTLGQLSDYNKSLYITNVGEYYETTYKLNPHNGTKYEAGQILNRRVRERLYEYLMDSFSKDGKEPREIKNKILARFDADTLYDNLILLDGVGPKTAILSVIALTGTAPSIVKNLANEVADAMFVRSDKSTLVYQGGIKVTDYRDEYSTALDKDVAAVMLETFSEVVRNNSGFKESALPTKEEIMKEVAKRLIRLKNGKLMLKSQYEIEQKLFGLCSEESKKLEPNADDEYIDMLYQGGLDDYQKKAVDLVMNSKGRVVVITGKAGVGKSHVITGLYRINKGNCVLTAYQNSACDVLSRRVGGYEFCGQPIKAIIGLSLKLTANAKFAEAFRKCAKLIIVDESSQIGTVHMSHVMNILEHAAPGAKLVLVGDILQTRPVCTYGLPFVHLVKSGACPTQDLAEFHRTNGRGILELCEHIRAASNEVVTIDPGCEGVELQQVPETERHINEMCKAIASDYVESDGDLSKFMVIAETTKECDMINRRVAGIIFNEPPVEQGLPQIRKGMVVVSTENAASSAYKETASRWKITNGSRYYILDYDCVFITLRDINGEIQRVPVSKVSRTTFKVAYAITVHKSQGSEASNVRYVFHRNRNFANAFYCDKTIKYVAFSRAQESLTLHEIFNPLEERQTESVSFHLSEQKLYDMSF